MMFLSFNDRVLNARSKTVLRCFPEFPERPMIISETPKIAPCLTCKTLSKHSFIKTGSILSTINFGLKTEITDSAYEASSRIAGSQCLSWTSAIWFNIDSRYSGN